ncbi:MAG: EpsD family peptidyl-prolyl cis-trans isomerase [Rhodocyclaceae bacterium]|nr:EpsD family peptidyl-prolyl cis-trans isomerase [Rhodocyclaceae bacterium]
MWKRNDYTGRGVSTWLLALILAGCGASGETGTGGATQVAARVNSDEITVHQINTVLSQARNLAGSDVASAGAQALERLIDQQLLVQQAEASQLDRDPRVLQFIDAARREILARAYLEQKAASAGRPSDADIAAYYRANPALFAERRVYNLQELAIRVDASRHDEIKAEVESAQSLQDIMNWLKAKGIAFAASAGSKPAEQLPMELLPRFQAMKDGQIALVRQPNGLTVVHLAGTSAQPIDEDKARPLIEQFLLNQRKTDLAKEELQRLRGTAEIAYLGAFSEQSRAKAEEAAPVASAATASQGNSDALARGVAGLK